MNTLGDMYTTLLEQEVMALYKALSVFANDDNWYDVLDSAESNPPCVVPAWRAEECLDNPEEFAGKVIARCPMAAKIIKEAQNAAA